MKTIPIADTVAILMPRISVLKLKRIFNSLKQKNQSADKFWATTMPQSWSPKLYILINELKYTLNKQ